MRFRCMLRKNSIRDFLNRCILGAYFSSSQLNKWFHQFFNSLINKFLRAVYLKRTICIYCAPVMYQKRTTTPKAHRSPPCISRLSLIFLLLYLFRYNIYTHIK